MARVLDREFHYSDDDFLRIRDLVGERTGIVLSEVKRDLVYSRLARRLRALSLRSFSEYCEIIDGGDQDELVNLVNAITTNLTAFFRESHHFDYLSNELLPGCIADKTKSRKLRIWSAGCSTGEEPYSIAMTVLENLPTHEKWDVDILATDLDSNVLAKASAGVYNADRVEGMNRARLKRWFQRGAGSREGMVKVRPELKKIVRFKQLNLMNEWPLKDKVDIIFCRNVVIYFDKPTQRRLFDRMADMVVDRGSLFIGHSESLWKVSERFEATGRTIYRKTH